jgi:DNA modification methylase
MTTTIRPLGPWDGTVASSFLPTADAVLAPGDCLETLQGLPTNSIKLVVTSPPYNLGKAYEKPTSFSDYLENLKPIANELARVLDAQGSLCWQVGNYVERGEIFPLDIFYYSFFKERGLRLRNRIIWHFGHGLHASKRFSGRYETILWFTKSDVYTFNLGKRSRG